MKNEQIKIFYGIPTVIERWEYAKELAEQIGIGDDHIFLDVRHKGCLWNKMRIYDYAAQRGYTHVCINDDDCIVCENYKTLVEKCVMHFPNAILTFFSNRVSKSKTPFLKRPNCHLSGAAFVLPLFYLCSYKKFYDAYLRPYKFTWEDTTTKMFALMGNIDVILVMPNMVTVREGLVTVARKGNYTCRTSLSFRKNFPEEILDSGEVSESIQGGLFNLHLPKNCDTAKMILKKWDDVRRNYEGDKNK